MTEPRYEGKPKVAKLTLKTEDVPIVNYVVTELPFNASGDGAQDDTEAVQKALNAAGRDGGGVVFLPAGRYKIASHLIVPVNVTLRGDWQSPEDGGLGKGTILMAYEGRGEEEGTPFIQTEDGAGLKCITIWYPEQKDINNVAAYPWTIQNGRGRNGYYGPNIINVTLINSYQGIKIDEGNNCHFFRNIYGTVLKKGLSVDWVLDIGREQTLWLRPKYWAGSNLGNPPSEASIMEYTRENATGIILYKSDWEYLYDIYLEGFNIGLLADESPNGVYNGQIWGLRIENGKIGMSFERTSKIGISVSLSTISTKGQGSCSIDTSDKFEYPECVMFNSCSIESEGTDVKLKGSGHLNFLHCTFDGREDGKYLKEYQLPQMPLSGPELSTYRRPLSDKVFDVTAFGAEGNEEKDNTDIFQQVLDLAASEGGGTVYVPAGRYRIDGHLKIAPKVELRGCSEGPHHYAIKARGTILIAGENMNKAEGDAFITLEDSAGVRGLSVFYPKQSHRDIVSYPPTVLCRGKGAYVIDVTFPDSYVAIKIEKEDYYIDYARGMGLKTFIDISEVSEPGYLVNVQNTVGDWQDGPKNEEMLMGFKREENAPPEDWWLDAPCCLAEGIRLHNASNARLFNNFTFGIGYGLIVSGSSSDMDIYGLGVDNAEHAIVLNGSGENINFINTELVSIGTGNKRYIYVPQDSSVSASFFNTLAWACDGGIELKGSGEIIFQQYKDLQQE